MNAARGIAAATVLATLVASAPVAATTLGDLSWMTGHWTNVEGGSGSEEVWLEPAGGLMPAVSRTRRDDGGVEFEYIRIEESAGKLVYQASPGGAPPTPFTLVELAGQKAVFENPEHDFPQRIVYWRDGEGLCARIEGTIGGKPESAEWCWKRARCD